MLKAAARMDRMAPSGIRKVNEKALAIERKGGSVIHFEIGRPDFDTPEYIKKAAIESLNATYRKLNRQRSVFPSDQALLKALYLATFEATKKWSMPIRNWGQVYGELSIMYEDRLPE